ncbi:hypothetical protein QJS04_geneDACA003644 [Acorus gramineus]|uniref:Uncharacterized protein n=1 Tax=Acorus gramineus TaxID=55184 RepID=A0AAV9BM62_ACOGR|nr:hypothetical protein QJS04_geneDACA003644 [Acorus gramineus]
MPNYKNITKLIWYNKKWRSTYQKRYLLCSPTHIPSPQKTILQSEYNTPKS